MTLTIPELSLVLLIGPSGSGKSTFARTHFLPTEVLSSDYFRGLVSDNENSQDATPDAFDVLKFVAAKRLAAGLLTVIDATNVQPESRKPLLALAKEHDVLPVAIVLNLPDNLCHDRNKSRPARDFGSHVIRNQCQQLRRSLRGLEREGFRYVHTLSSPEEITEVTFERQPLWNNRKHDAGPFDIIGDIHGCYDELVDLLQKLGYDTTVKSRIVPPPGRKAVFLGDLVDRGPNVVDVLIIVKSMVARGDALCVPGNHDVKLVRKLKGRDVQITHGLAESLEQLAKVDAETRGRFAEFLDNLVGHYVLDSGRLVVAHAGMKQQYIGRASMRVREFALYGETTGETDEFGLPVRHNWAAEYRGPAHIIYGHTPIPEPDWLNRTLNIDTGCVFGGKLTAIRWPEKEILSVPARQTYATPSKPFLTTELPPSSLTAQQLHDDVLDLQDVIGKRIITTRLSHSVTVREENAIAALEVMSRFAANPKWLIYLPPTMSPTETTTEPGLLEHPREAFSYFLNQGVGQVVCQEKHMGSRAVVIVCRDEAAAQKHFGITGETGIVYTRTGRRFFEDRSVEDQLLSLLRTAITNTNWWETFQSDWFCLDCELMPWSAKAQDLLKNQYAAVGAASRAALPDVITTLEQAHAFAALTPSPGIPGEGRGEGSAQRLSDLLTRHRDRLTMATQYTHAYRHYCWPVHSVTDLKLAPFHLLASEGHVHVDQDHLWHMQTLAALSTPGSPLIATRHKLIDLTNPASIDEGIQWWTDLTSTGGEGMVVKPLPFITRGKKGLVQPAIKCRGPEYLRIIYGPEYTTPDHLARLRKRGLSSKRSLALREFSLGIESLERFTRHEPLRRVHECTFAVLALESEPVDPRL